MREPRDTYNFGRWPIQARFWLEWGSAIAGQSVPAARSRVRAVHSDSISTRPVVIELYQSQGCSSCPPANADLHAIANRGDLLALSFSVTYWDHLGWKDTFGSPRFTARQQDYAHAGKGEVVADDDGVVPAAAEGDRLAGAEALAARYDELRGALAGGGEGEATIFPLDPVHSVQSAPPTGGLAGPHRAG